MVRRISSPNYGLRQRQIDMVVIHYTEMDLPGAIQRLCDTKALVSAHYLITKTGERIHMVSDDYCAWHAGESVWQGLISLNHNSLGIELDNDGQESFPELQMLELEKLLAELINRHSIPSQRILGHADIAPWRKIDPGPQFDWARLHDKGWGLKPTSAIRNAYAQRDENALHAALSQLGYETDKGPVLGWWGLTGIQVLSVRRAG